jgi:hypothetical protein
MPVHRAIAAEDHNGISLIRRVGPLDAFDPLEFLEASIDVPRPEDGSGAHVPRNLTTNKK